MFEKDGILATELESRLTTTRDRITEVLVNCIFDQVCTLNRELEELGLEKVTPREFAVALGEVTSALFESEDWLVNKGDIET